MSQLDAITSIGTSAALTTGGVSDGSLWTQTGHGSAPPGCGPLGAHETHLRITEPLAASDLERLSTGCGQMSPQSVNAPSTTRQIDIQADSKHLRTKRANFFGHERRKAAKREGSGRRSGWA